MRKRRKKREEKDFQRERELDSPSLQKRRAIQGFVTEFDGCRCRQVLHCYQLPFCFVFATVLLP
jgi:uncharacterized protein YceK